MTTDPLMWSPISFGRWFGTTVRVHYFFIVFALVALLYAAVGTPNRVNQTICWLALLLLALIVHELGHALALSWMGYDGEEIRLWPLGNMVGPQSLGRATDNILVLAAGPIANAVVVFVTALGLSAVRAQFVWIPIGNAQDSGAPMLANNQLATPLSWIWVVGWFGYVNYVILLANLVPALPFDAGRILRSYLSGTTLTSAKDGAFAPWTARACAAVLALTGIVCMLKGRGEGLTVVGLAFLIEVIVRSEARMIEDDGFFGDGVFGYDFSEGYTSLEGNAAKVRPYRESAIKRWRRRRSDVRRQRRVAREAAEERRMDEILEKLHRDGRHALSDEEHRFLVRVSAKYRNRPKAHE